MDLNWWQRGYATWRGVGNNCGNYVREAMMGRLASFGISSPNLDYWQFKFFADLTFPPQGTVTTEITGFRLFGAKQ